MAYILRKDVRVAEKVHLCMITKGNFTASFQARYLTNSANRL